MRSLVLLALLAGACVERDTDGTQEPPVTSHVATFEWPLGLYRDVDVLFVIDDTPAMAPFVARTQAMLHDLDIQWPVPPDLHLGVTTADPSDGGALRSATSVHGAFLADEMAPDWWSRTANHDGTIGDDAAKLGAVGTAGASNTPLAVIDAALATGLRRPNAPLAVIIVSASDDASSDAPETYAARLRDAMTDPNDVVVGIVAPASAPRLDAFAAAFPHRATTVALDASTYDGVLSLVGQLERSDLAARCIDTPLELDCTVEIVQRDGIVQDVPACPGPHCWSFVPDPWNACPGGGTFRIGPHLGTFPGTVRGQCVVGK